MRLTSFFGKSCKKSRISFKTNVKLETVVRKNVKNREKLTFQREKKNYPSPIELLNRML